MLENECPKLSAVTKDIEKVLRKHRVSMVVEIDESGLGSGVCFEPYQRGKNPDNVFWVDWWEHKGDSRSQITRSRLRVVK